MVYNEIGKTGMKVSNLGFGASSLGGVFHSIREEEGIEAVHTAVDNGINFIDVSPYYGHLKAETVLGKALKTYHMRNTICRPRWADTDTTALTPGTTAPSALRRVCTRVWSD